MLQQLRSDYGVRQVACEGGAELFRSLLELQLVDQLNLTIAPYIFGGKDAPTLTGRGTAFLPSKRPMFVSPDADRRRGVLPRIPAQILDARRRGGAAGPVRRRNSGRRVAIASVHFRAKGALVAADVGFVGRGEQFLASFAFVTNFQRHTLVH